MILSDLIQGSEEWLEVRKKKITSSDAAIINGTNTFRGNCPFKLWQKKMTIIEEDFQNDAMKEGNVLEIEARDWFNKEYKTNFKPQVLFNAENDWIMASLDGFDINNEYILEIKCGEKTYDKAVEGSVPSYYFDQIQHQLYASGKQLCYYLAYRPDAKPIVITVKRDEQFLKTLIEKEKEFYEYLKDMIPPPYTEKEYIENEEEVSNIKALQWKEAKLMATKYIEEEKQLRSELFDETDDGNTIFIHAGVKVQRIVKKGTIDYAMLIKDLQIKEEILEKYRKAESSWLQPSILKEA